MSGSSYFEQFNVVWLFGLTNSAIMMLLVIFVVLLFLKGVDLIPKRWQSFFELVCFHFYYVAKENLGVEGLKFFPFILSLFFFSLFKYLWFMSLCIYPNNSYNCNSWVFFFDYYRDYSLWAFKV